MELVLLTRIYRTRKSTSHPEFSGKYCTVHIPGKPHHRSTNTIHPYPLATPQIAPYIEQFLGVVRKGFRVRCCGRWVVAARHGPVALM